MIATTCRSCSLPSPKVRLCSPATTEYTAAPPACCMQWAADTTHSGVTMDPPHQCMLFVRPYRMSTMKGNSDRSASTPPTIRRGRGTSRSDGFGMPENIKIIKVFSKNVELWKKLPDAIATHETIMKIENFISDFLYFFSRYYLLWGRDVCTEWYLLKEIIPLLYLIIVRMIR